MVFFFLPPLTSVLFPHVVADKRLLCFLQKFIVVFPLISPVGVAFVATAGSGFEGSRAGAGWGADTRLSGLGCPDCGGQCPKHAYSWGFSQLL